jgi:MFS family permease
MTLSLFAESDLRAERREARRIGGLAPGLLLLMANATLLNLPAAEVMNGLASDRYRVLWITGAYGVAYTWGCMMTGLIAGQVGLSRCFWGCLLAFGLTGALSGSVDTVTAMTPLRIGQGFAKGAALTSAMVILWQHFPGHVPLWMAVYGAIAFAGALLGGPAGGLVIHYLSWRWLFLLQLPLAAVTALVAALALPHDRPAARAPWRVEVVGVALTLGWLSCLVVAVDMGHFWGWFDSASFVLWLAGFVVLFAAFLVWGAAHSAPAISTRILAVPRYIAALVVLDLFCINIYSLISLLSGYMVGQRGYQWWQGSAVLATALPPMLASLLAALCLGRPSDAKPRLLAGLGVMALATWRLAAVDLYTPAYQLALVLAAWGAGVGLATVPAMAGLFEGLAPAQVFLQTGIFNLNRFGPAAVVGMLLVTLVARNADAELDRLRLKVTHNRPAAGLAMAQLERDVHTRSGLGNAPAVQARVGLGGWVRANARVFALQTVLRYLALLTAGGLVVALAVPGPRPSGPPPGDNPAGSAHRPAAATSAGQPAHSTASGGTPSA